MNEDSIVTEVRQARDDYARRFNYDIDAIFEDLRRQQVLRGVDVVSFPPRHCRKTTAPTPAETVSLTKE